MMRDRRDRGQSEPWFATPDSEPLRARHPVLGVVSLLAFVLVLLFTLLVLRLRAHPVEPSSPVPVER